MKSRPLSTILTLALLAVGGLWLLNRLSAPKPPLAASNELEMESLQKDLRRPFGGTARPLPPAAGSATTNRPSRLARMLAGEVLGENEFKLTREQIDDYLKLNKRSAESLLTAAQLSGLEDRSALLWEAADKFPNDARVQLAVLTANTNNFALSPEDRRKWLEAFKQSSPDNLLPGLLSAREYFKADQPREAVNELGASLGSRRYNDFVRESVQNAEEAYLSAGYSPAEAKAVAMTSALLPQVSELRELGKNLAALEQQYRAAGDTATADGLMMTGIQIGQRLSDENSPTIIQELVAMAVERRFLSNASPALIDGPARLAQLDTRRQAIKQAASTDILQLIQSGNEAEIIAYFDRLKIYGEFNAMLWLKQRQTNAP